MLDVKLIFLALDNLISSSKYPVFIANESGKSSHVRAQPAILKDDMLLISVGRKLELPKLGLRLTFNLDLDLILNDVQTAGVRFRFDFKS